MRRLLSAVAVLALVSVACADSRSTATVSSAPRAEGTVASSIDPALVSRARAYIAERAPIPGWNRGMILRTSVTGPGESRRWSAVVINGGGRLLVIESCRGSTDAVAILVDDGDYVRYRTYFGCVDAPGGSSKRTVIVPEVKGAAR